LQPSGDVFLVLVPPLLVGALSPLPLQSYEHHQRDHQEEFNRTFFFQN
jgi:hypothetical protein